MKRRISVGMSAYNEEANIGKILRSVLSQHAHDLEILEVIVVLDGCTDGTLKEVLKVRDKRIVLVEHKLRLGKTKGLNEIFKKFKGDALVLIDADVMLAGRYTLELLVKPLFSYKSVGLTCGSALLVDGRTFIEKSLSVGVRAYLSYLEKVNSGNNIFACKGILMGLSRDLASSLRIPGKITASDAYIYFSALKKGFRFRFVKEAGVFYRLPSHFGDYKLQGARYHFAVEEMSKAFGKIADEDYRMNKLLLLRCAVVESLKNPFYAASLLGLSLYLRLFGYKNQDIGVKWHVSKSTKEGIGYV